MLHLCLKMRGAAPSLPQPIDMHLKSALQRLQVVLFRCRIGPNQVRAAIEALEMLQTRTGSEAIKAKSVRCNMQRSSFSIKVFKCRFIAHDSLKLQKPLNDRALDLSTAYQIERLARFRA